MCLGASRFEVGSLSGFFVPARWLLGVFWFHCLIEITYSVDVKRVLIVDTDGQLRSNLKCVLERQFEVLEAESVSAAVQFLGRNHPDLIFLNESLIDVCSRVRANPGTRCIPVFAFVDPSRFDSSVGRGLRRAALLDLGVDDVLEIDFFPEELLARVRSRLRLRRFELDEEVECAAGNLRLEPSTLSARLDGQRITLTPTEFDLLRYFLLQVGRVVLRRTLLGDLWPDAVVTRRTIDTHVANLRKKLVGFDHAFETIYGSGYRLAPQERAASA
ncbi:MAG: hypothetical protein RJB38_566 [Pseudomonadota bacterium]|jgi:DNA-binding response OmpR family regulator